MADLHLEAGEDHVERLAHENDPVRAVVELIWNAVDAEASEVGVLFEKNEMDAIVKVTVTDNGHGIEPELLASTFGRIGGSWKRLASKTKNGKRGLHGKRGEGRLRAFALGNRVAWVSHSVDLTGQLQRVEIGGSTDRRHVFFNWQCTRRRCCYRHHRPGGGDDGEQRKVPGRPGGTGVLGGACHQAR